MSLFIHRTGKESVEKFQNFQVVLTLVFKKNHVNIAKYSTSTICIPDARVIQTKRSFFYMDEKERSGLIYCARKRARVHFYSGF